MTALRLPALLGTVDTAARRLPDSPGEVLIGCFGAWRPYKGLDLFVEVARRFKADGVPFAIVGDGDDRLLPTDLPSNLTVDRRYVPDDELVETLGRFTILMLPYTEASQSGALTMALSLGIPMVATSVGALGEQVLDTRAGVLAEAVTADALESAVRSLLDDPERYAEYSRNGLAAARATHSFEQVAADVSVTFTAPR